MKKPTILYCCEFHGKRALVAAGSPSDAALQGALKLGCFWTFFLIGKAKLAVLHRGFVVPVIPFEFRGFE